MHNRHQLLAACLPASALTIPFQGLRFIEVGKCKVAVAYIGAVQISYFPLFPVLARAPMSPFGRVGVEPSSSATPKAKRHRCHVFAAASSLLLCSRSVLRVRLFAVQSLSQ